MPNNKSDSWFNKPLTPRSLSAMIAMWVLILIIISILMFIIALIFPSFGGSGT